MICKILGHKKPKEVRHNHIQQTGWEYEYNKAYLHAEVGYKCQRSSCACLVPIGFISVEKKNG